LNICKKNACFHIWIFFCIKLNEINYWKFLGEKKTLRFRLMHRLFQLIESVIDENQVETVAVVADKTYPLVAL
jgi:hypothetical protein